MNILKATRCILLFSFFFCLFTILTNRGIGHASNDPVLISSIIGLQQSPAIAYSDEENCFVVWEDNRTGSFDIIGAVVNKGMVLGQILICTAPGDQINPVIEWNGINYFIVWQDKRNGNSFDLFGARVSKMGILLDGPATASGKVISIAIGDQINPQVKWNKKDAYFIVWEDYRSGEPDVFGIRISIENQIITNEFGGIPICTQPGRQIKPVVSFNGSFFLVLWENQLSSSAYSIHGKAIDNEAEFTINPDNISPRHPSLDSNGENFIVVWDGINNQGSSNIYATFLDNNGQIINNSITISSHPSYIQTNPTVKWTGSYYTIFFNDERKKIFASRISADGLLLDMPPESGAISLDFVLNTGTDKAPALSFNNEGSIFLAWEEHTSSDIDLYGQIIIFSNPPILSFTNEPEFIDTAVSPTEGDNNTLFNFRVKYSHFDGKEPSVMQVLIDGDNDEEYTSPEDIVADMSLASLENNPDYKTGVIYSAEVYLPLPEPGDIRYRFFFSDDKEAALGKAVEGGFIKLKYSTPRLIWPDWEGYSGDGVHPNQGIGGDRFDFMINCISPDQQLPAFHEVWIDLNANLSYEDNEKFTMEPIDHITYSFSAEIKFPGVNTIQYRFFFATSDHEPITGEDEEGQDPAQDHFITISSYKNQPILSWIKEYQLYKGSIAIKEYDKYYITFKIGYSDMDNEPPLNSFLWLDLNNNQTIEPDETYTMSLADPYNTPNYVDNTCYTTEIILPDIPTGLLFYKFIFDDGANLAHGEPYTEGGTVQLESPLQLNWVNEIGFDDDGIEVMIDGNSLEVEFKVSYVNIYDIPPLQKEIWIDLDNNSTFSTSERFEMNEENVVDTLYSEGKIYHLSLTLVSPETDPIPYRFYFTDAYGIATGEPSQEGLSFSLEEGITPLYKDENLPSSNHTRSGMGCFIRSI
ncbi:MAG: hypothetical protein ACMUJM_08730 [bacterium]